jgi:pyruvate formate lyase activating enzyme
LVEIKGLEKFASKDYPGFITATVFIGGCNFRCPFCDNPDLVLRPHEMPTFPADYFLSFLDSRKGWLEAVCVTGGEPLMADDLESLIILIKDRGLRVKIDTNGSFPDKLALLLDKKLIDCVAMDIKSSLSKYKNAAGVKINKEIIQKSIRTIKEAKVESVFRMTVVPGLVEEEDIREVSKMLKGSDFFQLQQFKPGRTLDPEYKEAKPYPPSKLQAFAAIAEPFFSKVNIEGVAT